MAARHLTSIALNSFLRPVLRSKSIARAMVLAATIVKKTVLRTEKDISESQVVITSAGRAMCAN
jgi:hypothetical protein